MCSRNWTGAKCVQSGCAVVRTAQSLCSRLSLRAFQAPHALTTITTQYRNQRKPLYCRIVDCCTWSWIKHHYLCKAFIRKKNKMYRHIIYVVSTCATVRKLHTSSWASSFRSDKFPPADQSLPPHSVARGPSVSSAGETFSAGWNVIEPRFTSADKGVSSHSLVHETLNIFTNRDYNPTKVRT